MFALVQNWLLRILKMFEKLGFGLTGDADKFTVSVPRRRWDISIQADLVEEIARIYGYEKLPTTLPEATGTAGELDWKHKRFVVRFVPLLKVLDYRKSSHMLWLHLKKAVEFAVTPTNLTELMWPMTVDRSALRQNMVSGMLDTVAYNVNRKNSNVAIYEIGKVFEQNGNPKEELPNEINTFAFAISGLVAEKDFQTKATVDFFYAKGILLKFPLINLKLDYVPTKT